MLAQGLINNSELTSGNGDKDSSGPSAHKITSEELLGGTFSGQVLLESNVAGNVSAAEGVKVAPAVLTYFDGGDKETGVTANSGHVYTYTASALLHFNVFHHWVMHSFLVLSVYLYRYIDKGILEILGPLGLVRLLQFIGFYIELISTGNITHYSLILIGFMVITMGSGLF